MDVYRFDAGDGLEHFIRIVDAVKDTLSCETVHRLGDREFREDRDLDRCVFESMVGLGVLVPAGTEESPEEMLQ